MTHDTKAKHEGKDFILMTSDAILSHNQKGTKGKIVCADKEIRRRDKKNNIGTLYMYTSQIKSSLVEYQKRESKKIF